VNVALRAPSGACAARLPDDDDNPRSVVVEPASGATR